MTSPPTGRIPALLIEIRGGLTQSAAARASGVNQPSISKWEAGERVPKPDVAEKYARALGAGREQRDDLRELCEAVDDGTAKRQTRLVRGAAAQQRILAVERRSGVIRSWQCEIVPGLLQTWPYTLQVLGREPDAKWTAVRRERLALADDPDRQIEQITTEGVLRTVLGSAALMAEQVDRIADLSRRPNVQIGVLPLGRPVPAPPPSFHLFGEHEATNETLAGTAFLTERVHLDGHRAEFDRLAAAAIRGDELRELLARIAHEYRGDSQ